jgi:pyrroline-5-carboxylate reductase
MKLNVIGLGEMGSTLVRGMIDAQIFEPYEIIGSDYKVKEMDSNPEFNGIRSSNDNKIAAASADIILLAIKPQVMDNVLREISSLADDKLIISIAAGVTTGHLEEKLPPTARVVRVMPNTPALVKEGISAITAGSKADEKDMNFVKNILSGVGKVIVVEEEQMDAITGLSGSGPAYAYLMIEALADGGVLTGISRDVSIHLAAQTLLGAAKMVLETGLHPGELKDMVTSPGGTAIRGIEVLESHGLRGKLIDAVKEATERSKELNKV